MRIVVVIIEFRLVILFVLVTSLILYGFIVGPISAQSPPSLHLTWGFICQTLKSLNYISEPCDILVTPDGKQLTLQGKRVLICLLMGGVGKRFGVSDEDLKSLAPIAGCGPDANHGTWT